MAALQAVDAVHAAGDEESCTFLIELDVVSLDERDTPSVEAARATLRRASLPARFARLNGLRVRGTETTPTRSATRRARGVARARRPYRAHPGYALRKR